MDKVMGLVVFAVLVGIVVGFLLSWPMMMLWNYCLVPAVGGLHEVGWLQMWGIMVLFSVMFKSTVSKS